MKPEVKSTIDPPEIPCDSWEVLLEEDLEKVPEAAAEQRYARDAEEAGRGSRQRPVVR